MALLILWLVVIDLPFCAVLSSSFFSGLIYIHKDFFKSFHLCFVISDPDFTILCFKYTAQYQTSSAQNTSNTCRKIMIKNMITGAHILCTYENMLFYLRISYPHCNEIFLGFLPHIIQLRKHNHTDQEHFVKL